jgi:hypothetical protein
MIIGSNKDEGLMFLPPVAGTEEKLNATLKNWETVMPYHLLARYKELLN